MLFYSLQKIQYEFKVPILYGIIEKSGKSRRGPTTVSEDKSLICHWRELRWEGWEENDTRARKPALDDDFKKARGKIVFVDKLTSEWESLLVFY